MKMRYKHPCVAKETGNGPVKLIWDEYILLSRSVLGLANRLAEKCANYALIMNEANIIA